MPGPAVTREVHGCGGVTYTGHRYAPARLAALHAEHARIRSENGIPVWTIYDSPVEFPGRVVARLWRCWPKAEDTHVVLVARSRKGLRRMLPPGLKRIDRDETDAAHIVESWADCRPEDIWPGDDTT